MFPRVSPLPGGVSLGLAASQECLKSDATRRSRIAPPQCPVGSRCFMWPRFRQTLQLARAKQGLAFTRLGDSERA